MCETVRYDTVQYRFVSCRLESVQYRCIDNRYQVRPHVALQQFNEQHPRTHNSIGNSTLLLNMKSKCLQYLEHQSRHFKSFLT